MGLFLRKNHLLRYWGWLSLLNWIGAITLFLLLKLPPRELESWFVLWSFFLLRLLRVSINLPYGYVWNTGVITGLVACLGMSCHGYVMLLLSCHCHCHLYKSTLQACMEYCCHVWAYHAMCMSCYYYHVWAYHA